MTHLKNQSKLSFNDIIQSFSKKIENENILANVKPNRKLNYSNERDINVNKSVNTYLFKSTIDNKKNYNTIDQSTYKNNFPNIEKKSKQSLEGVNYGRETSRTSVF